MERMDSQGAARSHELLSQRIASIPDSIERALQDDAPLTARRAFPRPDGPLHVVGAGASAGPACMLAHGLEREGWHTSLVEPSQFALSPPVGPLCVLSQGLSPNARLALRRTQGPCLIVTAAPQRLGELGLEGRGVVLPHGPPSEGGMLVRVVGPVLASLAALRFSGGVPEEALARLPEAVASARCPLPEAPFDDVVLITAGSYQRLARGFRWKLIETIGFGDPPVYDLLQLAHGPYQQLFERRVLALVLDRGTPEEEPLYASLAQMLVPERHQLLRLRASLPEPLCWFEHDAQLNQLVVELLRRHPRDLIDWPGKGRDDGLYGLER